MDMTPEFGDIPWALRWRGFLLPVSGLVADPDVGLPHPGGGEKPISKRHLGVVP